MLLLLLPGTPAAVEYREFEEKEEELVRPFEGELLVVAVSGTKATIRFSSLMSRWMMWWR